jgi:Golgi phosphoprotein 3
MLTMLEEVVLLAVDEHSGQLRSTRQFGTAYALIGAILFDLALARRIDTDTENLRVVNAAPTGNATLDHLLAEMVRRTEISTVRGWIEELFLRCRDLEGEALASLIASGLLRREVSKRLWIIDVERFPLVNNVPQQHVKVRLAEAILTDTIPDTRDIMLVSIAEECGLLEFVLSPLDLVRRRTRVKLLCNLETIGRTVREAILNLDTSLRHTVTRVV